MGPLIDLLPLAYTDAVVALGALALGVAAGLVGTFAVLARRSLVGDALSHAALPGVALAFLLTGAKDPASLLVGAGIAAMLGAFAIVGIERTSRIRPDAAIGVVLSVSFSLGIVLITYVAGRGNAQQAGLDTYLFGQAAGLLERDVNVMVALAGIAAAVVVVGLRPLRSATFDREFAATAGLRVRVVELAITALLVIAIMIGLRAVGAILMVAMLIIPAVVARQFNDRLAPMLGVAALVGAAVGVSGALLSSAARMPTGPVVVLTGTALALAAIMLAPRRGVLWRALARHSTRRRHETRALLVDLETLLHAGPPPTEAELLLAFDRPTRTLRRGLKALDRAGLLERSDGRLLLSHSGAAAAHAALDARAMWSAWLEHGAELDIRDAREPDPQDLRASIGDENYERLRAIADGGSGE